MAAAFELHRTEHRTIAGVLLANWTELICDKGFSHFADGVQYISVCRGEKMRQKVWNWRSGTRSVIFFSFFFFFLNSTHSPSPPPPPPPPPPPILEPPPPPAEMRSWAAEGCSAHCFITPHQQSPSISNVQWHHSALWTHWMLIQLFFFFFFFQTHWPFQHDVTNPSAATSQVYLLLSRKRLSMIN